MAAVLTLQALHDYSDRETAEAVRFDVRWKVAIGAPLDDKGFDPSSLVYWRNRIARSGRPHRVSDAVKKVIQETGVLKGGAAGGRFHHLGRCGRHQDTSRSWFAMARWREVRARRGRCAGVYGL